MLSPLLTLLVLLSTALPGGPSTSSPPPQECRVTHNNPADWNVFDDECTLPAFSGTFPNYTLMLLPDRDIELVLITFDLVAGAGVANRYARIYVGAGAAIQTIGLSTFPMTASKTWNVTLAQGLQDVGTADGLHVTAPLCQRLRLGINPVVHLQILNGQAGDALYNTVVRTNLYLKTPQ